MIKIVYITENAEKLAKDVKSVFDYYFYDNEVFNIKDFEITGNETGFVFIMASGIVLRKYIPEIQNDKLKDPFVILMDESKKHVVPLLSNHIGGGNYFSDLIGNFLNLDVVKTTATDVNGKIGIDELSKIYFLENPKNPPYSQFIIFGDPVEQTTISPYPQSPPIFPETSSINKQSFSLHILAISFNGCSARYPASEVKKRDFAPLSLIFSSRVSVSTTPRSVFSVSTFNPDNLEYVSKPFHPPMSGINVFLNLDLILTRFLMQYELQNFLMEEY